MEEKNGFKEKNDPRERALPTKNDAIKGLVVGIPRNQRMRWEFTQQGAGGGDVNGVGETKRRTGLETGFEFEVVVLDCSVTSKRPHKKIRFNLGVLEALKPDVCLNDNIRFLAWFISADVERRSKKRWATAMVSKFEEYIYGNLLLILRTNIQFLSFSDSDFPGTCITVWGSMGNRKSWGWLSSLVFCCITVMWPKPPTGKKPCLALRKDLVESLVYKHPAQWLEPWWESAVGDTREDPATRNPGIAHKRQVHKSGAKNMIFANLSCVCILKDGWALRNFGIQ